MDSAPTQRLRFPHSTKLDSGKNVAIHCRQGIGRSALVAIGILASTGIDPEQAIEVVSSARELAVPETAEQRQWISSLAVEALNGNAVRCLMTGYRRRRDEVLRRVSTSFTSAEKA